MEAALISEQSPIAADYSPLYEKVALIDGDIVCWRAAAVAEKKYYLAAEYDVTEGSWVGLEFDSAKEAKGKGSTIWSRTKDKGSDFAVEALRTSMNSIVARTRPSSYQVWLSGRDNFRYAIAKTKPYKGHREYIDKPQHYKVCREALINEYGAKITEGYEADDAIGIGMGELGVGGFVASIDKDLDQLAGWHFNWVRDTVYRISRRDADFRLYTQILAGDPTDDVPGLEGIGESKARVILEGAKDSGDLFQRTWAAYRDRLDWPREEAWNYFLEQANLVYILRGKGKHYKPPGVPE